MSTRSTIWASEEPNEHGNTLHIYEECNSDGEVWLEFETPGVIVDIELPPAALKALASWVERNPGKE